MFTFARLARCFAASVVFAFAAAGCAESTLGKCETSTPSGGLRFAVSTTAASPAPIRVSELHVLNKRVNLQEPIMMDVAGNEVTVTFAMRQRDGITLAVDPTTLDSRVAYAIRYPERPKSDKPAYLSPEKATVALAGGGTMTIWADEASRRVFAQTFDVVGTPRGEPVAVSLADSDVIGAPRAATADGKHVVVAFFAARRDGFEIVAASLEATP